MDYYHTVLDILSQLASEAETAAARAAKLPEGELRKYLNGQYCKYYQKKPGCPPIYLPVSQTGLITQLGQHTYLQQYLEYHEKERDILQDFVNTHQDWMNIRTGLFEHFDFLAEQLKRGSSLAEELHAWENEPFEQCPYHPEQKRVEGAKGEKMRSKGEGDISYDLLNDGEPYHYEQLWIFQGHRLYPDFTIRHPQTGEFILWEHFGMIDNEKYLQNMAWKLKLYEANGFCPGNNLIVTYETKEFPLSHRRILNEIEFHFHH